MSPELKVPFGYRIKEEFPTKLADWIGDVFYDILPEHGYEVREEQIYTAFQLAEAVCNKKVHLAEAGLGTGKTFAYLLTALAYARFTGKPVVIACASTSLQEQLAGPKGDIQNLARVLGLEIDARMAKDPRQYICDERVNGAESFFDEPGSIFEEINQWLEDTTRGERSEIPLVPDRVWKHIGWEESMSCEECSSRGFCKLVKAREHYRPAKDLIIADHGIFFEDLWTREFRIEEGKLPILPDYSAVIFDEGHKVMLPALMRAGKYVLEEDIENIILSIEKVQDARDSLISATIGLDRATSNFFALLKQGTVADERSERLAVRLNENLLEAASILHKALDRLLLEFQIEQELCIESLPLSLQQTYELQIERAIEALDRFVRNGSRDVIFWVDRFDGSFWVVPRHLDKMLDKHLLQKNLPLVFTSATLSNEGDFSYFAQTLGLKRTSSSTVGSPFDLENQVVVYLPQTFSEQPSEEERYSLALSRLINLLKQNKGSALVVTNSLEEVQKIREGLKEHQFPFEILWEDQGERGFLAQKFREDESSVLVGANFWEGLDVPGEALTLLVIWQLPFPSSDPLIEVQRKEAIEEGKDPVLTVDYPEMGLKLKQGCGRLIRTAEDHGAIAILDTVTGTPWEKVVLGALPSGAKVTDIED